ncbi:hypothetical protein ATANTOWER_019009, partial [Ataeniobius toweri]|nr:hypothetical protein [Ataeniobius toweri]
PNNGAGVDIPGFTRFSRRNQFGEYHHLLHLSRTQFEDLLSLVEDKSGSGTPTTGAVSPLQNACPSFFDFKLDLLKIKNKAQGVSVDYYKEVDRKFNFPSNHFTE